MDCLRLAMPSGVLEYAVERLIAAIDVFQVHKRDPYIQPFPLLAKIDRVQRTLGDLAPLVNL